MGLKVCRDCKNNVSSKAKTCPNCGAPKSRFGPAGSSIKRIFTAIGLIAVVAVWAMVNQEPQSFDSEVTVSQDVSGKRVYPEPSKAEICRAGISTIMGQDFDSIESSDRGDVVEMEYVREVDDSKWQAKCKLADNQIIWGKNDGRWRDTKADGLVAWEYDNTTAVLKVMETYGDSVMTEKRFHFK